MTDNNEELIIPNNINSLNHNVSNIKNKIYKINVKINNANEQISIINDDVNEISNNIIEINNKLNSEDGNIKTGNIETQTGILNVNIEDTDEDNRIVNKKYVDDKFAESGNVDFKGQNDFKESPCSITSQGSIKIGVDNSVENPKLLLNSDGSIKIDDVNADSENPKIVLNSNGIITTDTINILNGYVDDIASDDEDDRIVNKKYVDTHGGGGGFDPEQTLELKVNDLSLTGAGSIYVGYDYDTTDKTIELNKNGSIYLGNDINTGDTQYKAIELNNNGSIYTGYDAENTTPIDPHQTKRGMIIDETGNVNIKSGKIRDEIDETSDDISIINKKYVDNNFVNKSDLVPKTEEDTSKVYTKDKTDEILNSYLTKTDASDTYATKSSVETIENAVDGIINGTTKLKSINVNDKAAIDENGNITGASLETSGNILGVNITGTTFKTGNNTFAESYDNKTDLKNISNITTDKLTVNSKEIIDIETSTETSDDNKKIVSKKYVDNEITTINGTIEGINSQITDIQNDLNEIIDENGTITGTKFKTKNSTETFAENDTSNNKTKLQNISLISTDKLTLDNTDITGIQAGTTGDNNKLTTKDYVNETINNISSVNLTSGTINKSEFTQNNDIINKKYVDDTTNAIQEQVNTLDNQINNETNGLVKQVNQNTSGITLINTTIGDENSGLIKEINQNTSDIDNIEQQIKNIAQSYYVTDIKTTIPSTDIGIIFYQTGTEPNYKYSLQEYKEGSYKLKNVSNNTTCIVKNDSTYIKTGDEIDPDTHEIIGQIWYKNSFNFNDTLYLINELSMVASGDIKIGEDKNNPNILLEYNGNITTEGDIITHKSVCIGEGEQQTGDNIIISSADTNINHSYISSTNSNGINIESDLLVNNHKIKVNSTSNKSVEIYNNNGTIIKSNDDISIYKGTGESIGDNNGIKIDDNGVSINGDIVNNGDINSNSISTTTINMDNKTITGIQAGTTGDNNKLTTKDYVDESINNIDYSDYVKKSEDIEGLETEKTPLYTKAKTDNLLNTKFNNSDLVKIESGDTNKVYTKDKTDKILDDYLTEEDASNTYATLSTVNDIIDGTLYLNSVHIINDKASIDSNGNITGESISSSSMVLNSKTINDISTSSASVSTNKDNNLTTQGYVDKTINDKTEFTTINVNNKLEIDSNGNINRINEGSTNTTIISNNGNITGGSISGTSLTLSSNTVNSISTAGTSDNDKLTSKGYVDNKTSIIETKLNGIVDNSDNITGNSYKIKNRSAFAIDDTTNSKTQLQNISNISSDTITLSNGNITNSNTLTDTSIINKKNMVDYISEHIQPFDPTSQINLTGNENNTSLTTTNNVIVGYDNETPSNNKITLNGSDGNISTVGGIYGNSLTINTNKASIDNNGDIEGNNITCSSYQTKNSTNTFAENDTNNKTKLQNISSITTDKVNLRIDTDETTNKTIKYISSNITSIGNNNKDNETLATKAYVDESKGNYHVSIITEFDPLNPPSGTLNDIILARENDNLTLKIYNGENWNDYDVAIGSICIVEDNMDIYIRLTDIDNHQVWQYTEINISEVENVTHFYPELIECSLITEDICELYKPTHSINNSKFIIKPNDSYNIDINKCYTYIPTNNTLLTLYENNLPIVYDFSDLSGLVVNNVYIPINNVYNMNFIVNPGRSHELYSNTIYLLIYISPSNTYSFKRCNLNTYDFSFNFTVNKKYISYNEINNPAFITNTQINKNKIYLCTNATITQGNNMTFTFTEIEPINKQIIHCLTNGQQLIYYKDSNNNERWTTLSVGKIDGDRSTGEIFNCYTGDERNIASGDYSHAEGIQTTASGDCSHAEGFQTTASGDCSHAEGVGTIASGNYSHAEGYYTTASGDYSHASGSYTVAYNDNMYVVGEYNIPGQKSNNDGKLFVIGNGTKTNDQEIITSDAFVVKDTGECNINGNLINSGSITSDSIQINTLILPKNPNNNSNNKLNSSNNNLNYNININKTITHNALIYGNIENYHIGEPVFLLENQVYYLQSINNNLYKYTEINKDNYLKNSINQVPKLTNKNNGKFIGIITAIYPANTPLKINEFNSYIKIDNDTIDFTTHGDYIFKVNNNTIEHQSTSGGNKVYEIGDEILYDGRIIDPDQSLTRKLENMIIGKITYIPEDNTDYVSVFKS